METLRHSGQWDLPKGMPSIHRVLGSRSRTQALTAYGAGRQGNGELLSRLMGAPEQAGVEARAKVGCEGRERETLEYGTACLKTPSAPTPTPLSSNMNVHSSTTQPSSEPDLSLLS